MISKSDNNSNTRLSLKLLESVIAGVNDAVLITKAEPVEAPHGPEIIYVNKSFERLSGYKAGEVIGKTPRIFQGPNTESEELQRLRNAIKKQEAVEVELLNYSKTGEEYWINISLSPIFDDGKCTHFISIQRDVSERVNIRKATEEVRERLEYAFKASEDILYDHDMVEDTILLSDNFQQIFGYSFADEPFTLEKWATLLHADDEEQINSRLEKTLADKKANKWEAEFRYARKDGTYANVKENAYIIRDDTGKPVRMIGIVMDISEQKQQELKKELSSNISRIFNESDTLSTALKGTLFELKALGRFQLAELWLADPDSNSINLVAYIENEVSEFYDFKNIINSFKKGEGLPGKTWKSGKVQFWKNVDKRKTFIRREGAAKTGLKTAYGFPILYNNEVLGALLFGLKENLKKPWPFAGILEGLAEQLGEEIHRKELEEELARIYESAPDGIIVAGFDGYFKKVNPAMCEMLGYSEIELLSTPFLDFVQPDDRQRTLQFYEEVNAGAEKTHFENRYITKHGRVIWLSWSFKIFPEEKVAYTVAKDITQQKEIEELYKQAGGMAKIGSWEVNLETGDIFLSDTTEKIFGVETGYNLTLEDGINFYKEGTHREKVREAVEHAIKNSTPYDIEAILVTKKGNEKWIRTIGKPQFRDEKCVRIYGSIQDIHDFKSTQLRLENMTNNLPGVVFQYTLKPDGNDEMIYISEEAEKIWGYSKEEASEKLDQIWDRVHKEDIEAMRNSVGKSAETLGRWHHFWRYHHPDGRIRWLEGFGVPQRQPDGSTVFDAIVMDITEKKELEVLLDKSNQMARIGSWELDLSTKKIYWTDVTREIHETGPEYEPVLEEGINFYKEGESRNKITEAVNNAIKDGTPYDLELKIVTAKGNERWVRAIGEPEFADGECKRIYGSFQDIHDLKMAEENLKVKSRHIEAISKLNSALLNYENWYNALNEHLEVIGEAVKSDRVYYFENRYDPESGEGYTTQKLEWCREGITPQLGNPDLDDIPFKEVPELIDPMLERKASAAILSDVNENCTTRNVMESQQIKAFMAIPVYVENRFHGFVGFDNCTSERYWSEEERTTLETITANLATAISRQHLDEQLQELFDEKNSILESIGDGFFAVNEDFTVTYWNTKAEKLLFTPRGKIMNRYLWDVFDKEQAETSYKNYSKALEERLELKFEDYYEPIDRWFDVNVYPTTDGISVFFKDITERKREQQLILKKTSQLDAIAQFNGQLITEENWVQALDNSLKTFGSVAKADRVYFFENRRNEATGKLEASMKLEWVAEGIAPEIQNEVHHNQSLDAYPFLSSTLKQRKAVSHIVKEIKDKKTRKFLESQDIKSILTIPVFTGRSFRGYIGFDDCTNERVWSDEEVAFLQTIAFNLASAIENEDAEQALEDAFEEKNEILESIGDAFFAVDKNWTVTYWNNIAEQLLGMPKEKIVGENLWDMYKDAVELDFYNQYHEAMENQVMVHFEEYYPGTGNWFEVSAYPSASGLSVFFKDVTDRKDSEQKLLELNKNLAEKTKALEISNAELEQFAFVASHDLQEPLRMISSFLTQLKRKYGESLDERAHKYIHFATDGAKRMRQIILDLLDYSRVGRIDTDRIEIDINELLDGVKKLHNRLIEEKQATVSWGRMPVITAAPAPMRQLFQNLFHNALYYHEAGNKPVVKIWAKELKNHWKFYIQDNGIGIEKEYSEKIFNIFQRLHLTDEFIGTGVGLAICKKIVEDHGGEIGVNSEVGKGSTFYFTIKKQY